MNALGKPLTLMSLLLTCIGLGLSAYLTYVHYNPSALVCSDGGCAVVQSSKYSMMFGVPIAIFGLLMFATLIAGIILRELRADLADMISIAILMILVTAVIYWAYLTYLELRVLYAVCQWCVATSIATVLLLIVEGYRWYLDYKSIGAE